MLKAEPTPQNHHRTIVRLRTNEETLLAGAGNEQQHRFGFARPHGTYSSTDGAWLRGLTLQYVLWWCATKHQQHAEVPAFVCFALCVLYVLCALRFVCTHTRVSVRIVVYLPVTKPNPTRPTVGRATVGIALPLSRRRVRGPDRSVERRCILIQSTHQKQTTTEQPETTAAHRNNDRLSGA